MFLRQNTEETIMMGPFVDTDGFTALTGINLTNNDVFLSKNGESMVNQVSGTGTHDQFGYYQVTLGTLDLDQPGNLRVLSSVSGLPVWENFQVVEEAVYDDIYASGAPGYARVSEVPTATEVVDEWESQSQSDPSGFKVNIQQINGTNIVGDGVSPKFGV